MGTLDCDFKNAKNVSHEIAISTKWNPSIALVGDL